MPTENGKLLELLTFRLGDQEYALDIMSVKEIRGWTKTTPMPHAPEYMKGVINLRGSILPVLDLSARLGLDVLRANERNVIVVANVDSVLTGLLVDAVSDIVSIDPDDLQPALDVPSGDLPNALRALCLVEDRLIRILHLRNVVNYSEGRAA